MLNVYPLILFISVVVFCCYWFSVFWVILYIIFNRVLLSKLVYAAITRSSVVLLYAFKYN